MVTTMTPFCANRPPQYKGIEADLLMYPPPNTSYLELWRYAGFPLLFGKSCFDYFPVAHSLRNASRASHNGDRRSAHAILGTFCPLALATFRRKNKTL